MIGVLALEFGLYGALVAFTINPAIVLLATATLVAKRDWFTAKFIFGQINKTALSELTGFGLMGLTSALAMPMTLIVIRDQLAKNIGLTGAGYWQASCKISDITLN